MLIFLGGLYTNLNEISLMSILLSIGLPVTNDIITTIALSLLSGAAVGFSLGLIGGGGSILAVPLLIYVVGVANTHVAIGTSALAVGANAIINMIHHKRRGHVKLKEGALFAIPGAAGTILGTQLGIITPSEDLLILFAVFMIVLSLTMLLKRKTSSDNGKREENDHLSHPKTGNSGRNGKSIDFQHFLAFKNKKYYRLLLVGFAVGIAAGYFGIGGGFIIVPALIHTISGLAITEAVGTSLIPVSTFGFLTAIKYSLSGEVNWLISLLFISGGHTWWFLWYKNVI
jgi:uncharacterized membrane protein YfcA